MEQERIWTLIARKLSEDASTEDLQELEQMIKDIPELGQYLQVLEEDLVLPKRDNNDRVEQAYLRLTQSLEKQNQNFFIEISASHQDDEIAIPAKRPPRSEFFLIRIIKEFFRKKLHLKI